MKKLFFLVLVLMASQFAFAQQPTPTKQGVKIVDGYPDVYPELVREGNTVKIILHNEGNEGIVTPKKFKTRATIGEMAKVFETTEAIPFEGMKEFSWELPPSYAALSVTVNVVADYKPGNNGMNEGSFRETNETNNKLKQTLDAGNPAEMSKKKKQD